MFDYKTLKAQSAREMLLPQVEVCVCVCVCVRACVRVCVCVCAPARSAPKWTSKLHFELWARLNDQIHTKYVKMASLESIHLNTVYVLSGWEWLGEDPMYVNILSYIDRLALGLSMLIKEQNTKRKSLTALNLNNIIALISINLSYSENYAVFIYIWFILDLFCRLLLTWTVILVELHEKKNCLFHFVCIFVLYIKFVSLFYFVYLFMFLLYLIICIKH